MTVRNPTAEEQKLYDAVMHNRNIFENTFLPRLRDMAARAHTTPPSLNTYTDRVYSVVNDALIAILNAEYPEWNKGMVTPEINRLIQARTNATTMLVNKTKESVYAGYVQEEDFG
jgi:hypothetical protein